MPVGSSVRTASTISRPIAVISIDSAGGPWRPASRVPTNHPPPVHRWQVVPGVYHIAGVDPPRPFVAGGFRVGWHRQHPFTPNGGYLNREPDNPAPFTLSGPISRWHGSPRLSSTRTTIRYQITTTLSDEGYWRRPRGSTWASGPSPNTRHLKKHKVYGLTSPLYTTIGSRYRWKESAWVACFSLVPR